MRLIFSIKHFFGLLLLTIASFLAQAQNNIQLVLGPDEIGENQNWTITITVSNEQLRSYDNFPEVPGFRKRGTSSQSSTMIMNGQMSTTESLVMTYSPVKQGNFTMATFSMKINDKVIKSPGKKIKVTAPIQRQQRDPFDSFFDRQDNFFGGDETEYIDVKDDAFLAVNTTKDEVYIGEGFNVSFSLFVAAKSDIIGLLRFHNLNEQLPEIRKKLKPANCWEEDFQLENIEPEAVTIRGKSYYQYKLFQSSFFPFNSEPVKFPVVGLEMMKFKVAKNPTFFGNNRKEDYKTYYTQPKVIKVKELPPHPLRDVVAVGDYQLDEKIRSTNLETGQSTGYEFNIYGEGNISAIEKPVIKSDEFEFYEPNVRQNINRMNNKVTGTKSFGYFMIPKEPGKFSMTDFVRWVYFNPRTKKYDTLKSKLVVTVGGESTKNEAIQSNDLGTFYDKMEATDNTLRGTSNKTWQKWGFNILILLMSGASAYLVLKKQKQLPR